MNKMDTRLRGYDTTSGKVKICKDSVDVAWRQLYHCPK